MKCFRCGEWDGERCSCKDGQTIFHGDCREILPELPKVDLVLTDPPYGMKKAEWDMEIPNWMPLIEGLPAIVFCGVIGMRDYLTSEWVSCWFRPASTQRIGKTGGFNNWEPILFFNITPRLNDVFNFPNNEHKYNHTTAKPIRLIKELLSRAGDAIETVLDPFMGSGTTLRACKDLGRRGIGIEIEEKYCEIAAERLRQGVLL